MRGNGADGRPRATHDDRRILRVLFLGQCIGFVLKWRRASFYGFLKCSVWHGPVCLRGTVSERVGGGGGKKRSAWQVCLSWLEPKRLPAAAFKVSLCVLWGRITKPLTHIQWCSVCDVLSAGLLHVHIRFARMHQHKGSSWVRTSCVTTPGVRDPPGLWSSLSLTSTRPQLSLCPLILSDPRPAAVGTTVPSLPHQAGNGLLSASP